jgi:hypothetical protein
MAILDTSEKRRRSLRRRLEVHVKHIHCAEAQAEGAQEFATSEGRSRGLPDDDSASRVGEFAFKNCAVTREHAIPLGQWAPTGYHETRADCPPSPLAEPAQCMQASLVHL